MCDILIFGGTSEGRTLAEFCSDIMLRAYISVTTEYGLKLLPDSVYLHPLVGKMNENEMTDFISSHDIKLVIDATHPYAKEATKNIANACRTTNTEYMRIVRDRHVISENAVYFDTLSEITEYLDSNDGNILLTVGSKETAEFCRVKNYKERCTVRVLPSDDAIEKCVEAGFDRSHIIAEKGPFTAEQNLYHLSRADAVFLVTKDSGTAGGFDEKIIAADRYGAKLLVLKRPEENGCTVDEAKNILTEICHE